ncbi:MAG: arylamine N-acetyltransferase, partial [Gammaproteobacteria bacterium]|nr:arylamine N-acetyltransferase [Gammaproteobacteria bacterium]
EAFRFVEAGHEYEQQVQLADTWRATYRFDLQPQQPIDYEAMNHFVATYPRSSFLTRLMAGRPVEGQRFGLTGSQLTRYRGGQRVEQRRIASTTELRHELERTFGIVLPVSPALEAALARNLNYPGQGETSENPWSQRCIRTAISRDSR